MYRLSISMKSSGNHGALSICIACSVYGFMLSARVSSSSSENESKTLLCWVNDVLHG